MSADDYGRFDGRAGIIRGQCLTAFIDHDSVTITAEDVTRWLDELAAAGLIRLYEYEGRPYLMLVKWSKHQRTRAKDSKFPAPDDECMHPLSNDSNRGQVSSNVVSNEDENEDENVFVNEFVNGNGNEDENEDENENENENEDESAGKDSLSSSLDQDIREVSTLYQGLGFGQLTALIAEKLQMYVEEYGRDWVANAIQEAHHIGRHRESTVKTILENWKTEGGMHVTFLAGPDERGSPGNQGHHRTGGERYGPGRPGIRGQPAQTGQSKRRIVPEGTFGSV